MGFKCKVNAPLTLKFFMGLLIYFLYWKANLVIYPPTKEVYVRAHTRCPSICMCSSE